MLLVVALTTFALALIKFNTTSHTSGAPTFVAVYVPGYSSAMVAVVVQMWNFVAGCWSSTDFFFPHKKSQQSIVTQRATCGCLEVI